MLAESKRVADDLTRLIKQLVRQSLASTLLARTLNGMPRPQARLATAGLRLWARTWRNTLNEEIPRDKLEGGDKEETRDAVQETSD